MLTYLIENLFCKKPDFLEDVGSLKPFLLRLSLDNLIFVFQKIYTTEEIQLFIEQARKKEPFFKEDKPKLEEVYSFFEKHHYSIENIFQDKRNTELLSKLKTINHSPKTIQFKRKLF